MAAPKKPPKKSKREKSFTLRVSEEDLVAWKAAADREEMPVSLWIRRACSAAIKSQQ
jgi:predicted DNA binding CopG/RHH family protein